MTGAPRKLHLLSWLLLCGAAAAFLWEMRALPAHHDDAYVAYQRASALVTGNGTQAPSGRAGPSQASPAWTVLLAATMASGLSAEVAGHALSIASGLAMLLATFLLARALARGWIAGLAPFILWASTDFALFAQSGLEALLLGAVTTVALLALASERTLFAIAALGLGVATRALSLPLLVALSVLVAARDRHDARRVAGMLALTVAVTAAAAALYWYVQGSALPATWHVKVGPVEPGRGLTAAARFLVRGAGFLLPPALLAGALIPRCRPALAFVAAVLLYFVLSGGDGERYSPWLLCCLPPLAALALAGVVIAWQRTAAHGAILGTMTAGALIAPQVGWDARAAALTVTRTLAAGHAQAVRRAAGHLSTKRAPPRLVASPDAGRLAVYLGVPTIGTGRGDFLADNPDYVAFTRAQLGASANLQRQLRRPEYWRRYAAAGGPTFGLRAKEPPGDVFLIVIDTLRADRLGIYGHERDTSPVMDRLARRGLVFEEAYAHSGWTLPSVASLITGRYPHEHAARLVHRGEPRRWSRIGDSLARLPEYYRDAGYHTAAFINNAFLFERYGLDKGFDHFDRYRKILPRSASDTVKRVVTWLDKQRGPSFVLLHFMEPHLPYGPPPSTRHRFTPRGEPPVKVPFSPEGLLVNNNLRQEQTDADYVQRLYDEEILAVDQALMQLQTRLKMLRRPGEPLFVVTSDHGEEFWDHGKFEHGHSLFGELLRIPLIVSGALPFHPARISTPVQHADVFQYLVRRAGGTPPERAHGTDLMKLVSHELTGDPLPPRPLLHDETLYFSRKAALTVGRDRLVVNLDTDRARLFRHDGTGQHEVQVIGQEAKSRIDELRAQLAQMREHPATPLVVEPEKKKARAADTDGTDPDNAHIEASEIERLRALGYAR